MMASRGAVLGPEEVREEEREEVEPRRSPAEVEED